LPKADGGILDVEVLLPGGPDLGGVQAAAVNPLGVAIRELVPGLGVLGRLVVHTEVPVGVLVPAAGLDELVLRFGRRLVLAPVVPLVEHHVALLDLVLRDLLGSACSGWWSWVLPFYLDGGYGRPGAGRRLRTPGRSSAAWWSPRGRSRASAGSSRLCPAIPLARTIWSLPRRHRARGQHARDPV